MRSNYKKLGSYIREMIEKNNDLQVEKLLGVSITKNFIPSIANVIGTDMSKYKIVRTNQFAYGPVTSRNGDKISIALLQQDDCIISTSYTVFEIIDHEYLDPEYLMMWFRRPEFDRYARYMSHGSVREIFGWEEMCEVELPVPSIEQQREIVREYNMIVNRIKLNEQLNQKLEETAQTIYKQWFVDFEFPISAAYAASIGKPKLEGKPYKSNSGEMVYCEELKKEIPKNWDYVRLNEMAFINAGGDKPKIFSEEKTADCQIPIYANGTINEGLFGFTNLAKIKEPCITISARGGIGYTVLRHEPFVPIVRLIVVKPKNDVYLNYLFLTIKRFQFQDGTSSAQSQLTIPDISSYKLIKPESEVLTMYQDLTQRIYHSAKVQQISKNLFGKLSDVLSIKMVRTS